MKRTLTNYRYYVLTVILTVTIIGIFAVPNDDLPMGSWLFVLVISKAIGFAAGYAAVKLLKRWERLGTIPELINIVDND